MPNPIPKSSALLVDAAGAISTIWFRFLVNLSGVTALATLDFPNTAAGACSDLTMDAPGVKDGDVISLAVPAGSVPANGSFFAWVSDADVVTIRYTNNSAATAYNPASGDFRIVARRFPT